MTVSFPSTGFGISPSTQLRAGSDVPRIPTAWPFDDSDLICDFDWYNQRYWSGSLGEITVEQAFTTVRNDSGSRWAPDGDGLLVPFAANTTRVTQGMGLLGETGGACNVDFNEDLSNARWTKTNTTVSQILPSPYKAGTPLGWQVLATADGGTITQTLAAATPSATELRQIYYASVYLPVGVTLTGTVKLTLDSEEVDITADLIAGRWVQLPGPIVLIADHSPNSTIGLKFSKSGDRVGFFASNLLRGYTMQTPIVTTGTAQVQRATDFTNQNMENFPPLWNREAFTVIVVCVPGMIPLAPVGDEDTPRGGWTVMEFNNPFNITATGVGEIVDDIMTIDSVSFGAYAVGDRLVTGTGALSFTDILEQLTGTPGGPGTYHVHSSLSDVEDPPTQTTIGTNITLQARLKDAQGYGLNSAIKIDQNFVQKIGVTFSNELADDESIGRDPQNIFFRFNEPNTLGWTMDVTNNAAVIVLDGDVEIVNSGEITSPVMNEDAIITWATQGPLVPSQSLDGYVQRGIIIGRKMAPAEIANLALRLQIEAVALMS